MPELALLHSLGYGGAPLHAAGGGTVLFSAGNIVRRVAADKAQAPGGTYVAEGLGVGVIAVHPEFRCYAVAERGEGARVRICDMIDGSTIKILEDVGKIDVNCMVFSEDGVLLATASSLPDFKVTVWEWETGIVSVSGVAPAELNATSVRFNPANPDNLCFVGPGGLFSCNVVQGASGAELEFMPFDPLPGEVTYSSFVWDENIPPRLFVTSSDGSLWSADDGRISGNCQVMGEPVVLSAEPVGYHLMASGRHVVTWGEDGILIWIGAETMTEGHRIKVPISKGTRVVSACLMEQHMFVGASDGSVFHIELLQDMPDGMTEEEEPTPVTVKDLDTILGEIQFDSHHRVKRVIFSHSGKINGMAAVTSTACVASAGADGSVIVWDTANGTPLAVQKVGRAVSAIACHPLSPVLAIGDDNGFIQILEASSLQKIKCSLTTRLYKQKILGLSFNDDGSLLAVVCAGSQDLYLLSVAGSVAEVYGYITLPLPGPPGPCIAWGNSRHVIVGKGSFLVGIDIPGKAEDGPLKLEPPITAIKLNNPMDCFDGAGDKLVCGSFRDPNVKCYRIFAGWAKVANTEELQNLSEAKLQEEYNDHFKGLTGIKGLANGLAISTCSADGTVVAHHGQDLMSVNGRRVFSVWDEGAKSVAVLDRSSSSRPAVIACSNHKGVIALLSTEATPAEPLIAHGASVVATNLMDQLNEPVELSQELTYLEGQMLEEIEVQNALNAAKKNETRKLIEQLKQNLDSLLELNNSAPEIEQIPRREIVIDTVLQDQIIAEGDTRVQSTKDGIVKDNLAKDLFSQRIKALAWDSMDVHGSELHTFLGGSSVFNYPLKKMSEAETEILNKVRLLRQIEINSGALRRKELGISNSLMGLEGGAAEGENAEKAETAEGAQPEPATEEDAEEQWRKSQDDPCLYHRFEVSTRERKTAQIIMVQAQIERSKAKFNSQFNDYLEKKRSALGRIEEKSSRVTEILKELKVDEEPQNLQLTESEQPELVLSVDDKEVTVEKWISPAERAALEEEEKRQAQANKGDETTERALKQMMGGSLAGESAVSKLDQEMVKPAHLEPAEGEELTEERLRELKEWEAQYKVFMAEKEAYAKALEGEAKKLKSEILEECKKFDESINELNEGRLRTDYKVYELELYKIKLIQAVAQEEDDIESKQALRDALVELHSRQEMTGRAVADYKEEVGDFERQVEAAKAEGLNLERQFRRELVDGNANKELAHTLFTVYKKRADLEEVPPGLGDDVMERAQQLMTDAMMHDEEIRQKQAQLEEMNQELERLEWANTTVKDSIAATEAELAELEERMRTAGSNLDITLELKQGQVEIEQAAVVTDYSDAEMVERGAITDLNTAITSRGKEKVQVLQEIKDFRKGIHQLQWDNSRLDLEEDELLHKTKDLQLLRVTKNLQSIIKGADETKAVQENAALEKLINYQSTLHQQRVTERAKSVEALSGQRKAVARENAELDEDIFALESAVVERQRLCELQGGSAVAQGTSKRKGETGKMKMMVTHRKLLDLAKAQTREIELMREELVRLRARTFPSFAQLSEHARSVQNAVEFG